MVTRIKVGKRKKGGKIKRKFRWRVTQELLQSLVFGECFQKPIPNVLPPNSVHRLRPVFGVRPESVFSHWMITALEAAEDFEPKAVKGEKLFPNQSSRGLFWLLRAWCYINSSHLKVEPGIKTVPLFIQILITMWLILVWVLMAASVNAPNQSELITDFI